MVVAVVMLWSLVAPVQTQTPKPTPSPGLVIVQGTIVDAWTPQTVPLVVVAAILIETAERDRFRGDDPDGPPRESGEGDLSVKVRELLRAYHDPVVA